ncbi:LPXTG cell wall anchor domain-containing protein [Staphylococcus auricularis]|uniref:LPXTG cell wall anchor domain-containing protein n=1 Tax=Staphylococcus auricularis TaxID=29379 RepID=UPI000D1ABF95|nr:LPXTG cell wall anchor domain-containing protein [Staphylococcus auricularis]MCE5038759.1 LPXTG cell wall anchor domain-containing protein [Staphylococcus auricularis]MEB6570560.1 LPXTG cell wall anchor domain-containing protein [Staphylococcus auricularis]PTH25103.1 hypothetical protein BU608_08820 [Staphylococcus auricularis]
MKKFGILGTTTLAGALLFTGISSNAEAAEISESQAENAVNDYIENNSDFNPKSEAQIFDNDTNNKVENAYKVGFGEEGNQGPTWIYVNKDTGDLYNGFGELIQENNSDQNNEENSNSEESTAPKTNEQQNNEATQQVNEDENQLPETGQTSNSSLATFVGAVLLAFGSLLTFKRFSKSEK